MRSGSSWLGLALVLWLSGCREAPSSADAPHPGAPAQARAAVIHGLNGRVDVYAHSEDALRARAVDSSVALVHANELDVGDPENIFFYARTVWDVQQLCSPPPDPYLDMAAAFCSGTLIDDALVLTAGHCVPTAEDCAQTRLVFKFFKTSPFELAPLTHEDVFQCQEIVARAQGPVAGRDLDYALLRLDRPATPRFSPALLRADPRPRSPGEPVAVIGTSGGGPLAIDSTGQVLAPRGDVRDYFVIDADMAAGSEGAGVYDLREFGLVGVLARGEPDYVWDPAQSCRTERVCTGPVGCRGEDVTYLRPALEAYCQVEANPNLCPPPESPPVPEAQDFTATRTDSARRDTVNSRLHFSAGDHVRLGTCGLPPAFAQGDTALRLFSPSGTELAFSDDACDGRGSQVEFLAPVTGDYEVRVGCHGEESCGGTVAWEVQ